MTGPADSKYEAYLGQLHRQEKHGRRNLALWTLLPAVLGCLLLAYSIREVGTAQDKVETAEEELVDLETRTSEMRERFEPLQAEYRELEQRFTMETERLQAELSMTRSELQETQSRLVETEARLQTSTDMDQFRYDVGMGVLKLLHARHPRQAVLLESIFELRGANVGWHLGGQTPDEGFDSPSFAAFILRQHQLFEGSRQDVYRLWDKYERVQEPEIGDLVLYPTGYAMFYYEEDSGRAFVIGMTPFGILALKPEFERVVGYYRIPYRP